MAEKTTFATLSQPETLGKEQTPLAGRQWQEGFPPKTFVFLKVLVRTTILRSWLRQTQYKDPHLKGFGHEIDMNMGRGGYTHGMMFGSIM